MASPEKDFSEIVIQNETVPPESGNQEKPKLTRSPRIKIVSLEAFLSLLRLIRSRPSRLFKSSEPEADVYHRLMDDLEDEEEPSSFWAKALVLAETLLLLGLVAALVLTVTVGGVKHRTFVKLRLWQWVALVMVLLSGASAVRFVTLVVFTPVKWRWRVHRYVVYFLEDIKWCVDVTLWLGLVLVAWYLWFRPRLKHVRGDLSLVLARQTTRLLIALVLGSFLWTLKNVLYLKLKADLHYDQLYERIIETVIDFHGIQIIYRTGMWKFLTSDKNMLKETTHLAHKSKESEDKMDKQGEKNDKEHEEVMKERTKGKNIWIDVCRINKDTVPIWVLHQLAKVYLKQMKNVGLPRKRDATRDDHKLMIEAQQMLRGVIHDEEGRSDILPEDLNKYDLNVEEREYLFRLFETQEKKEKRKQQNEVDQIQQQNKVISRDQFLSWAVVAYKNCWGLGLTLRSSERVFIKLNRILSTFLLTLMLVVWLLLSTIVDTAQLALLFTPFIAASFIFGDTCKKMFEGLIFTFAMHPFDVGDRVVIDNVQMKVTQLNILTSIFFKYDTGEEVVYPNSVLASTKIINLDITPDQADSLEFTIPSSTLLEDITDLELKIKKALDDDITYSSQTKVVKKEVMKEDIKMVVYFKYLVSYLAAETKAIHRSQILTKVMEFTKEMEINVKKASSSFNVGTMEFILDGKVTMEQIDELKRKMVDNYESNKEHCSKILMKGLDKEIQMVVYLGFPTPEVTKDSEDTKKLKRHICSIIESLNGRLKEHQTSVWSFRVSEVRSLGRMSEKEGASDDVVTTDPHE